MPFMFGRYTYVGNDPVNKWDPFGRVDSLGEEGTSHYRMGQAVRAGVEIRALRNRGKRFHGNLK
jgi:hypothetical protein